MKSLAIVALAAGALALAQPAAADGPGVSFGFGSGYYGPSGFYFSYRNYDRPRHYYRRHQFRGPYYRHGYRPYAYGPRYGARPYWQGKQRPRQRYGYAGQRGWYGGPRFHNGYGGGWGYGR